MNIDINLHTKVADLLQTYPQLEGMLITLSPIFAKLRNPVLRRTVAKMATLQQAATIAAISPSLLIQKLREEAGLPTINVGLSDDGDIQEIKPSWFDSCKIVIILDARPIIEAGKSPMQKILELASKQEKGSIMNVIVPFRPVPIIDILKSKGFKVWSQDLNNFFFKE